jgi:hypothetical protein
MGTRFLASEDEGLTRFFEDNIRNQPESDDAAWDDMVIRMLVKAGYIVRS